MINDLGGARVRGETSVQHSRKRISAWSTGVHIWSHVYVTLGRNGLSELSAICLKTCYKEENAHLLYLYNV